ncbi:hypothetical protein AB0N07_30810 [Streptomyces sp. NPDC051172]|uniref:hypothetical protein n=1 Tax=Streptomyces sp. NPDC051172 TaxID=3155796 RepID=UPI00342E5ED9
MALIREFGVRRFVATLYPHKPGIPAAAGCRDRILLGGDFPNIPYPYVRQLHALERLGLVRAHRQVRQVRRFPGFA